MNLNKTIFTLLGLLLCLQFYSCAQKQSKKVLLFSKTAAFRHESIEFGNQAITKLLNANSIQIDHTEDANYFTENKLKQYAAIIFFNTTGNVLDNQQQIEFEKYIQGGGGFVGIHSASDTEYEWPWYNQLVGAYFDGHPPIQDANLKCANKNELCCKHLPEIWTLNEEWYNFKSINPAIEVIMTIDEASYEGGKNGQQHPIVWKHHFDGGRSFYTAIGHKESTFTDPLYLQQLLVGVEFAMGKK